MAQALRKVSLKDKYELHEGVAYMSGLQALARIPLIQRQRDIAAGLNTAGFISGYRGSPLGGYDRELVRAQKYLDPLNVKFVPGVNEDLAATAVWGTQQVNLMPGAKVDGVFGIWYGKAPGVDRSGDVMRHASANGTAPKGGVLAIFGDDHACKSSTLACQSDHALYAMQIPQLYPANIQEFVEYGLLGIAMSRYSGCWTAMKVTSETVETSGTVDLSHENREILIPDETEFKMPAGGVHIRLNDTPREIDFRLQNYKLFACHAFARKNKIDRVIWDSPKPRFGIITSGKSYADVRQALQDLGITEEIAQQIGLRVYKVGMTWPLEPIGIQNFVEGLEEILIVEEKREFIEYQLKQQVYNWEAGRRPPVIVGKYDEKGDVLLPLHNDQSVGLVARVIAQRIERFYRTDRINEALKFYEGYEAKEQGYVPPSLRRPWYCSGCPHNTSTKVPDGSFAMVGIGCHYMVQWMDRNSALCTQMGGEGVPWIGSSPFSETKHIFANLGDGTYFHSGSLAIRASVAAKVNITYKILYNDAVAMTGGQHVDGDLPVWRVAQQVMSEGVAKAWILTEDMGRYKDRSQIPANVPVMGREWLPKIMQECRETPGTTVIIYDQTCAAEKRRRRKRGQYPDPAKRVVINQSVCEGCGDCSVQSNCIAVQPLETEYGRKRQINQSMCNKDFSCLKGFCPSFVTIEGGELRKNAPAKADDVFSSIPMPNVPQMTSAYNILVPGVGGTGVLTVGALLGMAAHLEGKCSAILDSTGLAQKGGEVLSHVRLAPEQDMLHNGHIIAGGTDLLLACDIVSAVGKAAHETLNANKTIAVANIDNTPVAAFVLDNKMDFKNDDIRAELIAATKTQYFVDATLATGVLLGDEMGTNVFMMGYAWQKGLIPVSFEAIDRAIELNGVSIDDNKKAFAFGRLAAHNPTVMDEMVAAARGPLGEEGISKTLEDIIAKRVVYLTDYQDAAYANRYLNAVKRFDAWPDLKEAVAKNYHKLLAYKDEYEVARLYTNGDFIKSVQAQFTGNYKLTFNLAPPIMEQTDPATGRPKKRTFGPWMMGALRLLAKFKGLRGTAFDPFGHLKDRKEERALITEYEAMMDAVLAAVNADNVALCRDILALPDMVRGYGPVKDGNIKIFRGQKAVLLTRLRGGAGAKPETRAAA
ncbi:indolepyruvate ferredoxin oxidoreductase family protein [Micavibrio aeruginosavorus]|uniref:Pyruvate ferredoxin/flavodoxin oxidoreductase family protein n=1 Tax=Micavibrio aeruginosavorus (strain ARL-13) TaxID=856793 RepID=G2KSE1_MICAA|nr:indolepyruvate ferredoxin oxidoreductase family protein [Micavibrio aeruginosavorus]AEP09225.1 pyruvate ferredoxin/flavodoxin oxidoreductase family protein [Micavibrio aeruginosavorus ARL-13]